MPTGKGALHQKSLLMQKRGFDAKIAGGVYSMPQYPFSRDFKLGTQKLGGYSWQGPCTKNAF